MCVMQVVITTHISNACFYCKLSGIFAKCILSAISSRPAMLFCSSHCQLGWRHWQFLPHRPQHCARCHIWSANAVSLKSLKNSFRSHVMSAYACSSSIIAYLCYLIRYIFIPWIKSFPNVCAYLSVIFLPCLLGNLARSCDIAVI